MMHDDRHDPDRALRKLISSELTKAKRKPKATRRIELPSRSKPKTRRDYKRLAALLVKMREAYRP